MPADAAARSRRSLTPPLNLPAPCPPPRPVLDIVARVDDALLARLGAEPGGCVPVEAPEMAALLALPELQAHAIQRVPGGSAANVMKGLAGLSGSAASCGSGPALAAAFVGMVGRDAAGAEYRASIAAHGVAPLLLESGSGAATATCLCLVTPDGQRTMRTSLCAALELNTPQLLPPQLGGAMPAPGASGAAPAGPLALLHCEGYCLYRAPVAAAAMRAARAAGARISIDLASFEVVQRCWAALEGLLQVGGRSCWYAVPACVGTAGVPEALLPGHYKPCKRQHIPLGWSTLERPRLCRSPPHLCRSTWLTLCFATSRRRRHSARCVCAGAGRRALGWV